MQALILSWESAIFSSLHITTVSLYIQQASGVCVDSLQNSGPKIVLDVTYHNAIESEHGC